MINLVEARRIIDSDSFKKGYQFLLNDSSDIVSVAVQRKQLYDHGELMEAYIDWQWLYSRLEYKIDRCMFSPNWLPISKHDYAVFVDLANPLLPVYYMWGCGEYDWEVKILTLSLRALVEPLGEIKKYLDLNYYLNDNRFRKTFQ